jgi:hypothetical protein
VCEGHFPSVTAADHNGGDLAVTERIWEMKQDQATKKWGTVQIAKSQIDFDKEGTYLMTYDAVDTAGNPAEQLAFALMIDDKEKPVITPCLGIVRSTPIEAGSAWSWCASEALDKVDGDISAYITYDVSEAALGKQYMDLTLNELNAKVNSWTLGDWKVTLKSTDAAQNTATKTVEVKVEDTTGPTITVHGRNPITSQQCKVAYDDATEGSATATDTFDDHWKNTVSVTSSIEGPNGNAAPTFATMTDKTGDYVITYKAADLQGNPASSLDRPVTVIDTITPNLSLNGFPEVETHYAGGTFSKPTVSCTDSCDGAPVLTEEWVPGFGVPHTYDPDLPAYVAELPATGCMRRCSNYQGAPEPKACGKSCIAKANTCSKVAGVDEWTACDADVFDKIMKSPGVKKDDHSTFFALELGNGNDKLHNVQYVKEYTCTDYTGLKTSKRVTYKVEDNTNPVLNIAAPARQELEASATGSWEDPGASCQDYSDGNIKPTVTFGSTGKPNLQLGDTYTVTYKCCDKAGNCADEQTRTVKVSDENCPVIELKGDAIQVVEAGFPWSEPGWTVTDDVTPSSDMTVVVDGETVDVFNAFESFRSCAEIKNAAPDSTDGPYVITSKKRNGSLKNVEVTCDMTTGQTYLAIENERIKPYGNDVGVCERKGFAMPKPAGLSVYAKQHFDAAFFPLENETTDKYLCTLDGLDLTHDVHTVDKETIKYAKKGVYKLTYHTQDAAGNQECRPRGKVTRTVVVKDTLAPVIVVRRPGSDKYAISTLSAAQKDKLKTLPSDNPNRDGIPSAAELNTYLRGANPSKVVKR